MGENAGSFVRRLRRFVPKPVHRCHPSEKTFEASPDRSENLPCLQGVAESRRQCWSGSAPTRPQRPTSLDGLRPPKKRGRHPFGARVRGGALTGGGRTDGRRRWSPTQRHAIQLVEPKAWPLQRAGRRCSMWHVVAHTLRGRWLFRTWAEGREVWDTVLRVVPDPYALCLMPDHLHLLCARDVRARVGRALGGWARRRNARDGVRGHLIWPVPDAVLVGDAAKLRRALRYVHMNPSRAGLVADPLAWPFSTHRDALGLTWPQVGPRRRQRGFHRYVSSDPSCHVAGSELPGGSVAAQHLHQVVAAVSAVLREPVERLGYSPVGRSLVWEACAELCPATLMEVADELRVGKRSLSRRVPVEPGALARVRQVLNDERFGALHDGNLRRQGPWARYGLRRGLVAEDVG